MHKELLNNLVIPTPLCSAGCPLARLPFFLVHVEAPDWPTGRVRESLRHSPSSYPPGRSCPTATLVSLCPTLTLALCPLQTYNNSVVVDSVLLASQLTLTT